MAVVAVRGLIHAYKLGPHVVSNFHTMFTLGKWQRFICDQASENKQVGTQNLTIFFKFAVS